MITLWIICFSIFNPHESPKYLMGHGCDTKVIEVLKKVAAYNGSTNHLILSNFRRLE